MTPSICRTRDLLHRAAHAIAAATLLCTSALAMEWSDSFEGDSVPRAWDVHRSTDTDGTVSVERGRLLITIESGRFLHLERPIGIDGTDQQPLRMECQISGQGGGGLPAGMFLWWDSGSMFGIGPRIHRHDNMQGTGYWFLDGKDGTISAGPGLGQGTCHGFLRVVVTSKDITAYASSDGLTYWSVVSFERKPGQFDGPPSKLIIGRGWARGEETRKPHLDNDARDKGGEKDTITLDAVLVTNAVPEIPPGAPAGYTKERTWDETLAAIDQKGYPKEWWMLGPLEPRNEPYGPEAKVDLQQEFPLQKGLDRYIAVPNDPVLEDVQEGDYTLAAWIRPASIPSGQSNSELAYALLMKQGWHLGLSYTSKQKFDMMHVTQGDKQITATSEDTLPPEKWYHVAGTVDREAGKVVLFVNGKQAGTASFQAGLAARDYRDTPWRIGVGAPGGNDWKYALHGSVDDVRIYRVALAPDDVRTLYEMNGAPAISYVRADDPDDSDTVLSRGDTLTIGFDIATNRPPARSKRDLDDLLDFGSKSLGRNYTGAWQDDSALLITVHNAAGGTLASGDPITIRADSAKKLTNRSGTSGASNDSSKLSGDWGEPLPPGLSGWWKLDDTTEQAKDSSGQGGDGTVRQQGTRGAYKWHPTGGRFGGALEFKYWDDPHSNRTEGTYVEVSDAAVLNPNKAITIALWVSADKWGNYGFYWPSLVRKGDQYQLQTNEVDNLRFYLKLNDQVRHIQCKAPSPGNWHHLLASYDGARMRLYVDGKEAASADATGSIAASAHPLHIGADTSGEPKCFDGRLDDVKIYSRALSEEEITELARSSAPSRALVGHWRLDEGSGEVAKDSSGRGNNAKVVGGKWTKGRIAGALEFGREMGSWTNWRPVEDELKQPVMLMSVLRAAGNSSLGFAHTRIFSDSGNERLYYDGQRWVELFVNGWRVGGHESREGNITPDRRMTTVNLSKGENHVVFKLRRENGGWGVICRHASANSAERIRLLRQLVEDFGEDASEDAVSAQFETARIWAGMGYTLEAIGVLGEILQNPGTTHDNVSLAHHERVRLYRALRDDASAAIDLRKLIDRLPRRSPERFELVLQLLTALARAGDAAAAAEVVAEIEKGERSDRVLRAYGVLAGLSEELGNEGGRLTNLRKMLGEGFAGSSHRNDIRIECAELLLAPVRKDYGEAKRIDASATKDGLALYREAIRDLPGSKDASLVPLIKEADRAFDKKKYVEALSLYPVLYLRSMLLGSEIGKALLADIPEYELPDVPAPGQPGRDYGTRSNQLLGVLSQKDQIGGWHVVGPFDNSNWKAYDEVIVKPEAVDTSRPVRDKKWTVPGAEFYSPGYLDLGRVLPMQNAVAFLYQEFNSDEAKKGELRIGADDGLTLWFNGKKMYEDRVQRGVVPDSIVVSVEFKKGRNAILARVQNGGGPSGFVLRIGHTRKESAALLRGLDLMTSFPEHHAYVAGEFLQVLGPFLQQSRYPEANVLARAIVSAFPSNPDVQLQTINELTGYSVDRNKNLPVAIEFADLGELIGERRAVEAEVLKLRHTRFRGARAKQMTGDLQGAADRLRKIIYTDPRSTDAVEARIYLAELYRNAGNPRMAAPHYREVMESPAASDEKRQQAAGDYGWAKRTRLETAVFDISFDATTLIRTADRSTERGDMERSLRGYQQAIDDYGRALYRPGSAKLVGVAEYCGSRLLGLEPEDRALYREVFDRRALALYERSVASRDAPTLLDVASRYPASTSADDALNMAGNLYLDGGYPSRAVLAFQRLLEDHPDTDLSQPMVLAKLALAYELSGDTMSAKRELQRLSRLFGRQSMTIGGRTVSVGSYVKEQSTRLSATAPRNEPATDEWPTLAGSPRRTGHTSSQVDPASCRLLVSFTADPTETYARCHTWPSPYRHLMIHPAISGGRAYFHTLDETYAVDLSDGKLAWRSGLIYERLRKVSDRTRYGGLPETMTTVAEGRVYSRALRRTGQDLAPSFLVEARSADTGQLEWSTEGIEELSGLSASSSPAVALGSVYVIMQEPGDSQRLHAIALDAARGTLMWKAPLAGGFVGLPLSNRENIYLGDHAAAPSAGGGDVYFSTDLGAVTAIDIASGAVRWVARYPRAMFDPHRGQHERVLVASRVPGRIIVDDDRLYVAPRDTMAVLSVKRSNGDILWKKELSDCRALIGLAPSNGSGSGPKSSAVLLAQGASIECIDTQSGDRLWRWTPPAEMGPIYGLAALGGEFIYAPMASGICRLKIQDGSVHDFRSWKDMSLDEPVGNLVLLRDEIVGFNATKMAIISATSTRDVARATIPEPRRRDVTLPDRTREGALLTPPIEASWVIGDSAFVVRRRPGSPKNEAYLQFANSIARIDSNGPRVVWRSQTALSVKHIAFSDRALYAAHNRHVSAIDIETGKTLWFWSVPTDESGFNLVLGEMRDIVDITASEELVAVLLDKQWHATYSFILDAKDGSLVRTMTTKGTCRALPVGRNVALAVQEDRRMHAEGFDADSGESRWRYDLPFEAQYWSTYTDGDKSLYFHADNRLICVDAQSGKAVYDTAVTSLGEVMSWFENGLMCFFGKVNDNDWRTLAVEAKTGRMVFEGKVPRSGREDLRGSYQFSTDKAVHARWRDQEKNFAVTCRKLAGGDVVWETIVKTYNETLYHSFPAGKHWVLIFGRGESGVSWQDGIHRFHYRTLDMENGQIVAEGVLAGDPAQYANHAALFAGDVVLYSTNTGAFAAWNATSPGGKDARVVLNGASPSNHRSLVSARPIRVDGRLNDWSDVESVTLDTADHISADADDAWSGPSDLSASIRTVWDGQYVYVSVDVTDDILVSPTKGSNLFTGDSLLLGIDPYGVRREKPSNQLDFAFHAGLVEGQTRLVRSWGESLDGRDTEKRDRVLCRASRRTGGIVYEFAFPWSGLRMSPDERPGKRLHMGLDIAVVDNDGTSTECALVWGKGLLEGLQPSRFGGLRLVDITPKRIAQYHEFIKMLPSHPYSWRFVKRLSEAERDPVVGNIAALEDFVTKSPAGAYAGQAVAELAKCYRLTGHDDPVDDAARFAVKAGVSAGMIGDALGPVKQAKGRGRYIRQWVYLHPKEKPTAVMLQFHTRKDWNWEHRAYWGTNIINWGVDGTVSRWPMGALPELGKWVELIVPIEAVGIRDNEVKTMSFTWRDGLVFWDRTEYVAHGNTTVLIDDELPAGSRFEGSKQGHWVDTPVHSGRRAHGGDRHNDAAEYHLEGIEHFFKTTDATEKDAEEVLTASRKTQIMAASIIPDDEEAMELLKDSEALYDKLEPAAKTEAIAQMYEGFLRRSPGTKQAYKALNRIRELLESTGGDRDVVVARCEELMDETHVSREQRRLFYRFWVPRIKNWKVLGYFDPGNQERNFEAKLPPENFPVLTNAVYEGAKEKMIPWRDLETGGKDVVVRSLLGASWDWNISHPVTYLYTRLSSRQLRKANLMVGATQRCVVWLNNKRVGPIVSDNYGRSETAIPVQLEKGMNELLLKVIHYDGNAHVSCRVADLSGKPVPGIESRLPLNIVSAAGYVDPSRVEVVFSANVNRESAERASNYTISGAMVEAARLGEDERTVVLLTSALMRRTDYSIVVKGVFDTNDPPQPIEAKSRTSFAVRGNGTGLTARYYDNADLTDMKVKRVDPTVNFDWGDGSPMVSIGPDTFSVRWTGTIEPLFTGEHTFHGVTDDGVKLWVNEQLLIDKWNDQSAVDHFGKITLEADKSYSIKMEMYENGGGASAKLFWTAKKQPREIIPASQLYPEE